MARTEIVAVARFVKHIVFRRIGMSTERRRVFRCTVTIFVGRYGRCGDRMDRKESAHRQGWRDSPITSGQ